MRHEGERECWLQQNFTSAFLSQWCAGSFSLLWREKKSCTKKITILCMCVCVCKFSHVQFTRFSAQPSLATSHSTCLSIWIFNCICWGASSCVIAAGAYTVMSQLPWLPYSSSGAIGTRALERRKTEEGHKISQSIHYTFLLILYSTLCLSMDFNLGNQTHYSLIKPDTQRTKGLLINSNSEKQLSIIVSFPLITNLSLINSTSRHIVGD